MPDVILIYLGTNDWGYGVGEREFYNAYKQMLRKVRRNYPAAGMATLAKLWLRFLAGEDWNMTGRKM